MGARVIPSLQLIIANGEGSSLLNDCWIPGRVVSRSVLEINWDNAALATDLKDFIIDGGWNHLRISEVLGDRLGDLTSHSIFDPTLERDTYVWGSLLSLESNKLLWRRFVSFRFLSFPAAASRGVFD